MRLKSEIKYDNATFTNRNLARTHRYGIENKVDYKLNNQLVISNSFSVAQSKYRAGHRRDWILPVFLHLKMLLMLSINYLSILTQAAAYTTNHLKE